MQLTDSFLDYCAEQYFNSFNSSGKYHTITYDQARTISSDGWPLYAGLETRVRGGGTKMFIPFGTIVKDENDVKKYCVGKDVSVRSSWLNETKQFDVSEYYSSFSSIQSREYTIYCEPIGNGFKVVKVHRWR